MGARGRQFPSCIRQKESCSGPQVHDRRTLFESRCYIDVNLEMDASNTVEGLRPAAQPWRPHETAPRNRTAMIATWKKL
jgi:hypothetical protein